MSGVAFAVGWVYWKTGKYNKYAVTGPFDKAEVATWEQAYKDLGEFNKLVTITAGNVGTLDALNRGEIWMGPVWVDMFFTFMNEGSSIQDEDDPSGTWHAWPADVLCDLQEGDACRGGEEVRRVCHQP